MSSTALGLVLLAAAVHAGWNALAKRAREQFLFLWSTVGLAGLLFSPGVLWAAARGELGSGGWPFVAATGAIHAVYFFTLGRAYRYGDLSLVYPIARGLGIALVPVVSAPLLGEGVSLLGGVGIGLVVAGAAVLGLSGGVRGERAHTRSSLPWAIANGLTIAAYSLVDARGVRHVPPVAYVSLLGLGCALLLAPVALARREALVDEWRRCRRTIPIAATLNLTSYLLVLFAFRLAKTAYVVAARELSIVLSTILGVWLFGEGRASVRLPAALVILAGVTCVVAAR